MSPRGTPIHREMVKPRGFLQYRFQRGDPIEMFIEWRWFRSLQNWKLVGESYRGRRTIPWTSMYCELWVLHLTHCGGILKYNVEFAVSKNIYCVGIPSDSGIFTMLLVLSIWTCFVSTVTSDTEVQVALLLPNDTYRLFSVHKMLPAIKIGIERAQSDLVPNVKFNVSYADTKCHIAVAMNEAIKFRYSRTVHVFFGPVSDYAVAPVARQVSKWKE
jgi:hypothetical protein